MARCQEDAAKKPENHVIPLACGMSEIPHYLLRKFDLCGLSDAEHYMEHAPKPGWCHGGVYHWADIRVWYQTVLFVSNGRARTFFVTSDQRVFQIPAGFCCDYFNVAGAFKINFVAVLECWFFAWEKTVTNLVVMNFEELWWALVLLNCDNVLVEDHCNQHIITSSFVLTGIAVNLQMFNNDQKIVAWKQLEVFQYSEASERMRSDQRPRSFFCTDQNAIFW